MSSFWDAFTVAMEDFLRLLFAPVEGFVETFGNELLRLVVGTPYPDEVFAAPTNGPWPAIYDYYWSAIIPLTLLLYGVMVAAVIFLESTSYLFGSYHRAMLKKRLFTGLLGILAWWWIAALALRFVDAITGFIVPDLSEISLFQSASFSALGVLGFVLAQTVELTLFLLIALVYLVRHLGIYLFVLLMPLLIVAWIPGVGPLLLVSRFMSRLAGFTMPLLFMTVPVAVLLRLGQLLGDSTSLSLGGVGAWLVALVIPFAAIISPLVLFWQAGALFFFADRAAHRMSVDLARQRLAGMQETTATTRHAGQNFRRGLGGDGAVSRDGQYLFDATRSRAYRGGARLGAAGSWFRESPGDRWGGSAATDSRSDGGRVGGAGAASTSTATTASSTQPRESKTDGTAHTTTRTKQETTDQSTRNMNFENLRGSRSSRPLPPAPPRNPPADSHTSD